MTREEAIEAIKAKIGYYESDKRLKAALETLIPELAESEDERIRKEIVKTLEFASAHKLLAFDRLCAMKSYLEKQKEQKPVDDSDFKTKLAEYMTKNCTKGEGPYGYSYNISSESILQMAEEELLKRGVVQKPAEWSEEEYGRLFDIEHYLDGTLQLNPDRKIACIDFLKSLRPSWKPSEVCYGAKGDPDPAGVWKPSEEQMEALRVTIDFMPDTFKPRCTLITLLNGLEKLI